jgi:hypothetical protein
VSYTAPQPTRAERQREKTRVRNERIDLLDALGLEAGTDWQLWRRPSNGQISIMVAPHAAQKMLAFIDGNPAVRSAVRGAVR